MRLRFIVALLIVSIFFVPSIAQDELQTITPGSYEGVIDDNNVADRYVFEAFVGQEVTISMDAGNGSTLDPQLFLFDANDEPIADNDDTAGSRNAEIIFSPTTSGLFIIEATRFRQNVGTTSGGYILTLTIVDTDTDPNDPLSSDPPFTVSFTEISFGETVTGSLTSGESFQYYVIGAEQGDFTSLELTTANNLEASIRLLTRIDNNLSVVSRAVSQNIIFATIPQTGWYLIEVQRISGVGNFVLTPTLVSDTLLSEDTPTIATFDAANDTRFFVFNATINERVFVNLSVLDGNGIVPELTIFDLSDNQLDQRSSSGDQTRVTITAPRSNPYIVQARNLGTGSGTIEVQIRRTPADISKLTIRDASYNEDYVGFISDDNPIDYYRFSGKAGELVTIQMQTIGASNPLDPYVILVDANLNELIFNDNASASRTARIAQFALPSDGDYFILASRAGLSDGLSVGAYNIAITVGELKLEAGALTATLTWDGIADLNLFIQTPDDFTISWANPAPIGGGGNLQIDSNTACNTPTDEPIEHIYWSETPTTGDYTIWVWYQDNCITGDLTPFTLTLAYDNETIHTATSTEREILALENGERFETSIRLTETGNAVVVNRGTITTPSPQQTASQGGDTLIVYDVPVTGSITDEVFAQFYQFEGEEGDTVVITVERITGNLDPIVVLRDSRDVNLALNDDFSPDNRNSQIVYTLDADRRYVIAVTRFGVREGTTTGNYRLTLSLQSDTENPE